MYRPPSFANVIAETQGKEMVEKERLSAYSLKVCGVGSCVWDALRDRSLGGFVDVAERCVSLEVNGYRITTRNSLRQSEEEGWCGNAKRQRRSRSSGR